MRLPETRDLFAKTIEFPTTKRTVIDAVGDEELHAPGGDDETIAEVLARTETEEFRSADELYDTLLTFVSDAFIGRKYYDDRGTAVRGENDEVNL